jgi:hypothetical protein
MNLIKRIVKHGSFSEEDLITAKSFINKDASPEFYIADDGTTNTLPKGLEFVKTILTGSSTIVRNGFGSKQPIRKNGLNHKKTELAHSISVGWNLALKPICVVSINGQLIPIEGRTRLMILFDEYKYKNALVNVYRFVGEYENSPTLQDDAIENFGLKANEDSAPAGYNLKEDWVQIGVNKIDRGTLEANYDAIESWLQTNAKSFTKSKITTMASTIHQQVGNTNAGLQLIAWSDKQGESWLNVNGYVNTKNVLYHVVSSDFPSKAIFSAAALAQKNPGKEIHIVLHTGKLEGKDVAKSYVDKVLDFVDEYYLKLSQTSFGFFNGKQFTDSPIKLVGALPANVFNLCEDEGELIIFGVNDQKLIDYKENNTSASLNKFFELDGIIN